MNEAAQPITTPTFPRTGTINFHDTHVAIWEDWNDEPGDTRETKEARRQDHFRGVEAAFDKLIRHLRARGFSIKKDPRFKSSGWLLGRKGDLEFSTDCSGRTAKFEFFQNVANVENRHGGRHDFGKFQRMPRDMRLRCAVEMIQIIRAMQALGYTFGEQSDLSEPLAAAVLRKAEGRENEGLSPIEQFNRRRPPRDRIAAWPAPESIQVYDRKDKDGRLLCNGDVRYFYGVRGRLVRGQVFHTGGNCWPAYLADGTWFGQPANFELFSTDRPDLLPRRVHKETQVSRVSRELGKARVVQSRIPGNPMALGRKLPACLMWMAPILWAASVTTAAARVSVLERVLARLTAGERGYYVLSLKDKNRGEKHLTFFRQNAAGYVWSLAGAGRFQEPEIQRSPSYYDNEETTVAVPCEAAEKLADADGCVPDTKENLAALLRAAGQARGARGQGSIRQQRKAERAAQKAQDKARRSLTEAA